MKIYAPTNLYSGCFKNHAKCSNIEYFFKFVIYQYKGMLPINKKKQSADLYNMNEAALYYPTKWKKPGSMTPQCMILCIWYSGKG